MTDTLMNGANGALPAHLQGTADQEFGGGMDGNSYPRLAFKTSRFRLRQGDDETVLEQTYLDVIILKDYPHISRIFFEDGYDADGGSRPSCASADGETPVSTIAYPQSSTCASCPQNEKGSAITDDGKKSRACSFFKRVIVLIKGFEDVGPVVADIKSMSLFGDSKSGQNQWTLKAYFARLKANGVMPFHLWTRLSFDIDMSVPKVLFHPLGYVSEPEFQPVLELINTPDGQSLLEDMSDTSSVRVLGDEDDERMQLPAGEKPKHLTGPAGGAEQPDAVVAAANSMTEEDWHGEQAKPEETVLERQLREAVEAGDYTKAGQIQQAIAQHQKPDPKPEPAASPTPSREEYDSHEAQCSSLKADIKVAVEAADYAKAGDLQTLLEKTIKAWTDKYGERNPAPKEVAKPAAAPAAKPAAKPAADKPLTGLNRHGVRWNPDYHSTVANGGGKLNADGHWAAKRGISPALKALVKQPEASTPEPTEETEPAPEAGETLPDAGSFDSELEGTLKEFGF